MQRIPQTVDLALRALRAMAAARNTIVLSGDDDLVWIARSLHRRLLGPDRPFVVCDPRRKKSTENVRNAENYADGRAAIRAAARGTLCVWSHKLPRDFNEVQVALQHPDNRVHLVVCTSEPAKTRSFGVEPLIIPPLGRRPEEIERVIYEYALDAMREMEAAPALFTRADREWVRRYESATLQRIETATLRLAALRQSEGNISRAAARLGIARMSLNKWIGRRKLPLGESRGVPPWP